MDLTAKKSGQPKAFTLTEILIVLIALVIMAAFAIPNYQKTANKSKERNAVLNLMSIHGANEIYRAKSGGNDQYLPGAGLALGGINSGLSTNIIDKYNIYNYTRTSATTYTVTATLTGEFQLTLTQNSITAANPCCSAGTCLLRNDCP